MPDKKLENRDNRFHESLIKKLSNRAIVGFLLLFSKLPFSAIYKISDFICFLLQKVIRYRKDVIFENIAHAFPEKNEKEIKETASKFYSHFSDLILETIKMHGMTAKQISDRVNYKGLEKFEEAYKNGKSLVILGMHQNNWEWSSSVQLEIKHQVIALYNPVRGNQTLEKFLVHAREKWGGKCIPVHKSGRAVLEFNRAGIPTFLGLGADQTPPATSKFWTMFLNREAPFFSGPEKIAIRTNQPVFFHYTRKTGRGRYEVTFSPLVENPRDVEPNEILLRYVRKMEEVIREDPEYYLWSHRRWKHARPEEIPLTI